MIEEWKDIPGYEGLYQVSSFGNVRSLNFKRSGKIQILKNSLTSHGYYFVRLRKDNKTFSYHVHQLVAMAFYNHKPNGFDRVVNHIDRNKLNNRVDNLNLMSMRENTTEYRDTPGVTMPTKNSYCVNIIINGDSVYLGTYKNKNEAITIYNEALSRLKEYNGDKQEFKSLINPKLKKRDEMGIEPYKGKFYLRAVINGKRIGLGYYKNKESAILAKKVALSNQNKYVNTKQFIEFIKCYVF